MDDSPIHPMGEDHSTGPLSIEKSGPVDDVPSEKRVRTREQIGGDAKYVDVEVPEGEDPWEYVPPEHVGNPIAPNRYCRGWNGKESRMKYCKAFAGTGTDHKGVGRCKHHGGNKEITTGARIRYADKLHHRTIGELLKKFQEDPDPQSVLAELDLARALLTDFINRYSDFSDALIDWHASFKLAKRPLSEEDASAYERVVTEYAIMLKDRGEYTDLQLGDIERAERFVKAYRKPVEESRPRKVVDIIDARQLIDTIAKLVERLDKRDTISEAELNRTVAAFSRVVDVLVTDAEIKRLIREGWMRVVSR